MQNDIVSLMDGTCATGNSTAISLAVTDNQEERKAQIKADLSGFCALWPCRHI